MRDPTIQVAFALDAALVRLARGRGAVELAIGETLLEIFKGLRLLDLGYARKGDYARERLGVPPRTMFAWTRLAKELADRPVLRQAVVSGAVSPRKALTILPVAYGPEETAWAAAAAALTLRELEERVRAAGGEPLAENTFVVETLLFSMTPAQQDRLDEALSLAGQVIGAGASRWQCLEAVCQEWLGAFGGHWPEGEPDPPREAPTGKEWKRADSLDRQLAALREAGAVVDLGSLPKRRDAWSLEARVLRLLEARRTFDEPFGRLLAQVVRTKVWRLLGYRTLDEYCRERLGMSPRTVRQRVWLERRMRALPPLREALSSGKLTFSKALVVGRDATAEDVEARIEAAASTTVQQLEREATKEEERQNRAAGLRREWAPEDVMETVACAIGSATALAQSVGRRIGAGEALAIVAEHFIGVWKEVLSKKKIPKSRRKVLMRAGGLCAVPGCSRPAEHVHHIEFLSRGGPDAETNKTGLCTAHHLRGVHEGRLEVLGLAGHRLEWRLGALREGAPVSVWVTEGDDEVLRVG